MGRSITARAVRTDPATGRDAPGLGGGRHADRTAHACSTEPAIPAGVLREVLLMVVLGVVELRRRQDLGRDRPVTGPLQFCLKRVTRRFGGPTLVVAVIVDAGPVLRADVVALAHALGGVVVLPERLQ